MGAMRLVLLLLALACGASSSVAAPCQLLDQGLAVRAGRWNALHFRASAPWDGRLVVRAGATEFAAPAGGDVVEVLVLWPASAAAIDWWPEDASGTPIGPIASRRIPVHSGESPQILVASDSEGLIEVARRMRPGGRRAEVRVAAVLPRRVEGYDAIDLLLLDRGPIGAEETALLEWIELGGLAAVVAPGLDRATGFSAWCQRTTGVRLGERRMAESEDDLVRLAGAVEAGPGPFDYVVAIPGTLAIPMAWAGHDPLVLITRRGLGAIVLLAFDPGLSPLSDWIGTPKVLERLECATPAIRVREAPPAARPGGPIRPILVAIALYGLAAGPVTWLLARTRRLQPAAWLLPFATAGAGLLLLPLARSDDPVRDDRTVLVGRDGSDRTRAHDSVEIFFGSTAPVELATGRLMASDDSPGRRVLEDPDGVRFLGIEGPLWSRRVFRGRRRVEGPLLSARLRIGEGRVVQGSVRNDSGADLTEVWLVAGRSRLVVGPLAAGAERPVEGPLEVLEDPPAWMPLDHRPAWAPAPALGAALVALESGRPVAVAEVHLPIGAASVSIPIGGGACWPATSEGPIAPGEFQIREVMLPAPAERADLELSVPSDFVRDVRLEVALFRWEDERFVPVHAGPIEPATAFVEPRTGRVRLRLTNRTSAPLEPGRVELGATLRFR